MGSKEKASSFRQLASLIEEVLLRESYVAKRTGSTSADSDGPPPPSQIQLYADHHQAFDVAIFDCLIAATASAVLVTLSTRSV